MDHTTQPQKAFIYYRKNYLFGIARPGVLVYDNSVLTCYDNDLQPVFSEPIQSIRVKEGLGIFKVFVAGKRISIITPIGSGASPQPSEQLTQFLQTFSTSAAAAGGVLAGSVGAAQIANAVSPTVPMASAAGVGLGVAGEVAAIAMYAKGQQGVREFLQSIGVINA